MKLLMIFCQALLLLSLAPDAKASDSDSWRISSPLMIGALAGAVGGYLFLRNPESSDSANAFAATMAGAGIGMAGGMVANIFIAPDTGSSSVTGSRPIGIVISRRF